MQKIIHLVGWNVGEGSFGVTKPYLEYFSQFGQVEILTPRKGIVKTDLLVLPGGQDMNPANYNQVPSFYTGNQDVMKEYFYRNNLKQYIDANIPVFGICLGFQQLNCYFGGDLTQHWSFGYTANRQERKEELSFTNEAKEIFDLTHHTFKKYKVNTMHHQGLWTSQLGNGLIPLAISDDTGGIKENKYNGHVEAFLHEKLPVAGVQYHSEEIYDSFSELLIRRFLNLS